MRSRRGFAETVAVITGASCGIGAATAIEFVRRGGRVVLVGRREAKLKEVASQCRAHGDDGSAVVLVGDVAQPTTAHLVRTKALQSFGAIDVLVNNAGQHVFKPIVSTTIGDYHQMFDTNFLAAVNLTQTILPCMMARRTGAIVNITSITSALPDPGEAAYGASKAALSMWSHVLSLELHRSGVSVSVVSPGPIATETMEHTDGYYAGRRYPAESVARAVLYAVNRGIVHRSVPRRFGVPVAIYGPCGWPIRKAITHVRSGSLEGTIRQ